MAAAPPGISTHQVNRSMVVITSTFIFQQLVHSTMTVPAAPQNRPFEHSSKPISHHLRRPSHEGEHEGEHGCNPARRQVLGPGEHPRGHAPSIGPAGPVKLPTVSHHRVGPVDPAPPF
jgi:hypothetical protein